MKRVGGEGRKIHSLIPNAKARSRGLRAAKPLTPCLLEKPLGRLLVPVPRTDTGGLLENSKVSEITLVKELGKIVP